DFSANCEARARSKQIQTDPHSRHHGVLWHWEMTLTITSVTYRRLRLRTILATGRFSPAKTAPTAGGLRETLGCEITFASAGGRLPAGRRSSVHIRFRHDFLVAGG